MRLNDGKGYHDGSDWMEVGYELDGEEQWKVKNGVSQAPSCKRIFSMKSLRLLMVRGYV